MVLILLLLVFIAGPLLLLLGINLLGFAVPYTLGTWFGAFLIMFLLNVRTTKTK